MFDRTHYRTKSIGVRVAEKDFIWRRLTRFDQLKIPPATWKWDSAFGRQKAFIRTVQGQYKEYWIDVNETNYQSAFKGFLGCAVGGVKRSSRLPPCVS